MVDRSRGNLARLFEEGPVAGQTDGQLLDRFATRRGDAAEVAFEALVSRHGPMVARVCRTCLRDEHDVEDAFQATFLVLVRRANSLGERDLLGPWLYGVAHRVARKARAVAARRRTREGGQADLDPPAQFDGSGQVEVELAPVLHEEVNRLPDKYRQPVVLCHLQGLTHAEAAHQLAWPVGTVSVRLVRARKLLADRLARRGIAAPVTLVAATLTSEATAATLAPAWAHAAAVAALTAATGLPLVAGTAAISAGAVTLARRTSLTLLLSSWKWLTIPMTLALATGTGAMMVGSTNSGEQALPTPNPRVVPPPTPQDRGAGTVQFYGPGSVIERKVNGVSTFEGSRLDLSGKLPELADMVKSVQQSDPDTTYDLKLLGKKVRYQPSIAPTPAAPDQVNDPEANKEGPAPGVPSVVEMPGTGLELGPLPPGYFDLAAPDPAKPGSPRPVQIGQTLEVDLLEALPGRPLNGKRVVRGDGTVSLGYYGDLFVAGLNRDQIKVKLIEKMRVYLKDETLGLLDLRDGKWFAKPPIESDRVFVDDQPDFAATAPHPPTAIKKQSPPPARSETPLRATVAPDPALNREASSAPELVKLHERVADLSAKLDSVLKAIEQLDRRSDPQREGSSASSPRTSSTPG